MQEQLHVGKPNYLGLLFCMVGFCAAFVIPVNILGLHFRNTSYFLKDANNPMHYSGQVVEYAGWGPNRAYAFQTNQIIPLFVLIPPFRSHSDLCGMRWLADVKL